MKKNNLDLHIPQRQSLVALLFIILQAFRNIIGNLWPIVIIYFIGGRRGSMDNFYLIVAIITVILTVLSGFVSYFRYFYILTDTDLQIQKGLFRRTNLVLPYERVQVVNTKKNLIHRYTNTLGIRIETAGSSVTEIDIPAIDERQALRIKEYILSQRGVMKKTEKSLEHSPNEALDDSWNQQDTQGEIIVRLSFIDVLKYGLTHNHFRSFGAILALTFFVVVQVSELFMNSVVDLIQVSYSQAFRLGLIYLVGIFVLIVVVTIFISVVMNIMRYYNLTVIQRGEQLTVSSGLIQVNEHTLRLPKIQVVTWTTNPLRKFIGLNKIIFTQAGSDDNISKQAIVIAGVNDFQREHLIDYTIGDSLHGEPFHCHPHPNSWLIQFRNFGIIPVSLLVFGLYFAFGWYACFAFVIVLLPLFLIKRWYRNITYTILPDAIRIFSKIYGESTTYLDINKIQMVKITQSPYEVRRNLATVQVYSAGGSINMLYIPYPTAKEIRDYVIYRVETSRVEWM